MLGACECVDLDFACRLRGSDTICTRKGCPPSPQFSVGRSPAPCIEGGQAISDGHAAMAKVWNPTFVDMYRCDHPNR